MFGGDVHLRTYADLQRCGIAPYLGRIGMDDYSREFADVRFSLVGVGTRREASARRASEAFHGLTGGTPRPFWGDRPWEDILAAFPDLDILAVATPDDLHAEPAIAALRRGVHAIVEKPMALDIQDADRMIAAAQQTGCLLGLDMHKRYDPDHLRIFRELMADLGTPLFGRAVLEEPLEVSAQTFQWASRSDPFSYVGVHWTDLFIHYLGVRPRSVFALGQKRKLLEEHGINAYDAVQVSVVFDSGLHVQFNNHWITPADFEGPVNQESEIVATHGKVESDTQYRGLRYAVAGKGSRTANTHFTRQVARPDGTETMVGYGKDSLIACVLAVLRRKYHQVRTETLAASYPDALDGRLSVAIIHAARVVRDRNFEHFARGRGTPATALLNDEGITVYDPVAGTERIYNRPV
jgi:predicted dehydrogenase